MDATQDVVTHGQFGVFDYIVVAIVLCFSASIGIYFRMTGGKQKTVQEYLLGDHSLSVVPVAFSLMASFMSSITLMGVSSENYNFGTQFVVINIAYGLVTPVAAYLYLPVFFRLKTTSAYHYLEKRFGPRARLMASLAFSLQMVLYMGIVLYAPALAVEAVTGFSKITAIFAVGLVCTFYSTIGGMKAVVITDVFQSLLMFTAVLMVCITAAIEVGGISSIWQIAKDHGRVQFNSFSLDPTVRHTWWNLIIGGGLIYLSLYAVNQAQVQRLLSVRNLKSSQRALWISWPVLSALSIITSFSGLAIFSKYYKCDPVRSGRISSDDQLMPLFVVDTVSHIPGLSGLFVAGIFSGSLSTVSSAVNSLAAVTLEDYLKPIYHLLYQTDIPEHRTSLYTKILALLYGLVCLFMAILAQFLGGVLQASLTIFGAIGGPLLGTFSLGMFFITSNEVGAVTGLVCGLCVSLWLAFGGPKPPAEKLPTSIEDCSFNNITVLLNGTTSTSYTPINKSEEYFYLYRLSYLWLIVIGFLITILVGMASSWIAGFFCAQSNEPPNADLFNPCIRKHIKKRQRKLMQAGVVITTIRNGTETTIISDQPKLLPSTHL